ncbi:MAG: NAD(P)/FAD-dependent oxidoreductase [archaeon]
MFEELFDKKWDVIVVGAGPGGSVAARECAKRGLKTLVIEKRQEIGAPVRCGEGLGEVWMKKANLSYDPSWCRAEMHGAVVYGPKKAKMIIPTANKGYVIDRKVFEKVLAQQAIFAGAKYAVKSRVYDVIKDGEFVKGVKVENGEGRFEVEGKIIVAADGVDSQTAKYAGINTVNMITEVDSGFEYEMAGINIDHEDKIHIFVGNSIAPRGYIWVFPKGHGVANVGIGILGNSKKSAKSYLDEFIESRPDIFENSGIYEMKGGCVPVGEPLKKPYGNGIVIIGDAAHMVNPIHGGGMGTSMEAAMIAAPIIEKAIKNGDVSEKVLKEFSDKWYEERGNQLLNVLKVRKFFEKLSDDDMEALADFFTPETLLEFSDGKKLSVFAKFFVKNPRLALLAAKTLM